MKVSHQAVRDILEAHGPMTGAEVAEFFPGVNRLHVSAVISTLHTGLATPQLRIVRWQREIDGQRLYLRAVYALGGGRNAGKPDRLTNAERCERYRTKRALPKGVPNSVWQWGQA